MKYSFHPAAEAELIQAIDYYEECEQNLGYDFALEVYNSIQRIIAYPKAWPALTHGIRRSLVRRFPYGILYTIENDEIIILAVMNLHREPDYWKNRL